MGTETPKSEDNYSCEPVKTSDSYSSGTPSNLPQTSKMPPMMFLLFLIMSLCTAINLSLNDAYTLAKDSVSCLNLTSPCWICINGRRWGYVQPIPGYQWPTLPAQSHAVTQHTSSGHGMAFWEKGEKNFMPWYQQQLSIFTPMIISAIPPKNLFSLLTNIPQVTFPICLKIDSLTGVSVGNLDNDVG